MIGRVLHYLLSLLLPLSPMLCGHCQNSRSPELESNICCSRSCGRGSVETDADKSSGNTCPPATVACQSFHPIHNRTHPGQTINGHIQTWERLSDTPPRQAPMSPEPCRHEHCRSAICAQQAVVSRPVDWTQTLTDHASAPDRPIDNTLLTLTLAATLQALHDTPRCVSPPRGTQSNSGPTGRAARIAYASWLI